MIDSHDEIWNMWIKVHEIDVLNYVFFSHTKWIEDAGKLENGKPN